MTVSRQIMLDVLLCAATIYGGVYLDLYSTPDKKSFRCDDVTIRFRKQPDTVSPRVVLSFSIFVPLFIFILVDFLILRIKPREVYTNAMAFFSGGSMVYLSSNLIKYNLASHRPYFLDICKPDWSKIDCTQGNILDYQCLGDEREVKFASLSFPSLHAALSWYGMLYSVFYIYCRLINSKYRHRMWTCAQGLCITWAAFVSMSRISDFRHHLHDVIAGAVIGVCYALVTVWQWSAIFKNNTRQVNSVDTSSIGSPCHCTVTKKDS